MNLGASGVTALKLAIEMEGIVVYGSDDTADPRGFEGTIYPGEYQNPSNTSNETDSQCMIHQLESVGATIHCRDVPTLANVDAPVAARFDHNKVAKQFKELNNRVHWIRSGDETITTPDAAVEALKALQAVETYRKSHGSRILCLDGGGVRGLMQIEMLRQIEQRTGKRITELFDWIVGTSTGGILALALVYGMFYT